MALETQKTVLVVNKQPKEIVYLKRQLGMAGFDVSFARTGAGAIKAVEEHLPDIVLLETNLSDMDAVEVVKAIRAHPKRNRTPIIAISAFPYMKSRYLDNGCDGFLQKPIKVLDLIAQIRKLSRK